MLGTHGALTAVSGELEVGASVLTLGHEDLAPDSLIKVSGSPAAPVAGRKPEAAN